MRSRATAAALAAAVLLLASCAAPGAGPDGAADPSAGAADGDGDAAVTTCTAPAAPADPRGTVSAVTDGRGPDPVGPTAPRRDVPLVDLGRGDAVALAATLAEVLDPCGTADPVPAAGGLGAVVVAGVRAAAEGVALAPVPALDTVVDAGAGATAAAAATLDLVARWGAGTVLVVAEDDVVAWSTLVVEATEAAVPLVLPAVPTPDAVPTSEAETTPDAEPAPGAETPPDVESAPGDGDAPAAEDPAVAALGAVPDELAVTVVASDDDRAAALVARVVAAGLTAPGVRVLAAGVDAPPVGGAPGGALWLVDPSDPVRLVTAAAAAGARAEGFLAVDPDDPTGVLRRADALRRADPERFLVVGGGAGGVGSADRATTAWALDVALHTDPLPWGGWLPLEDTRIVALYGTPGAPSLGALGQQDLDGTIERVREFAARYDLDGLRIVPGFDLIVTVASAAPGPAGDYSQRVSIERLRPLVDRARDEGMAVFIDLQPGRTDFLVQAQEYEELLLEPHVFLALDPEWRLEADQVHLRQIGSVEAAEVQRVADWLAALVRRERLPQKAFMLHQFLLEMLPDRDTVVVPPELVGVVHVDGQGAVATKERTFRIMAEGADPQWRWGWKQFLRIDTPTIMDPADVIDRTPVPVVITYQ